MPIGKRRGSANFAGANGIAVARGGRRFGRRSIDRDGDFAEMSDCRLRRLARKISESRSLAFAREISGRPSSCWRLLCRRLGAAAGADQPVGCSARGRLRGGADGCRSVVNVEAVSRRIGVRMKAAPTLISGARRPGHHDTSRAASAAATGSSQRGRIHGRPGAAVFERRRNPAPSVKRRSFIRRCAGSPCAVPKLPSTASACGRFSAERH